MGLFTRFAPLTNAYIGFSRKGKLKPAATEIHGYKNAKLIYRRSKVFFKSPTYNEEFGVFANAVCRVDSFAAVTTRLGHRHNLANCTCGFYSFKKVQDAFDYPANSSFLSRSMRSEEDIVLETITSGQYIEYSKGYRSEKQRVKRLIAGTCQDCYGKTPATAFVRVSTTFHQVCTRHAQYYMPRNCYTFERLAQKIAVPEGYKYARPVVTSFDEGLAIATGDELQGWSFKRFLKILQRGFSNTNPADIAFSVLFGLVGLSILSALLVPVFAFLFR